MKHRFFDLLGFPEPAAAAPTPAPPKVTFTPANPDVVAVGLARALDYAALVPSWTKLGTIESNGKPIAALFRWTAEGEPRHPAK